MTALRGTKPMLVLSSFVKGKTRLQNCEGTPSTATLFSTILRVAVYVGGGGAAKQKSFPFWRKMVAGLAMTLLPQGGHFIIKANLASDYATPILARAVEAESNSVFLSSNRLSSSLGSQSSDIARRQEGQEENSQNCRGDYRLVWAMGLAFVGGVIGGSIADDRGVFPLVGWRAGGFIGMGVGSAIGHLHGWIVCAADPVITDER